MPSIKDFIPDIMRDDQRALEVPYDGGASGIPASNVQSAIDSLDSRVDSAEGVSHTHTNKAILDVITAAFTTTEKTKLAGIESGATADQNASEVPYNNTTSGLAATQVQAAIDEVEDRVGVIDSTITSQSSAISILQADVISHESRLDTHDISIGLHTSQITNLQVASHTHSNKAILDGITSVGSGQIITATERSGLHTHSNKAILDGITSVGSGAIITVAERNKLAAISGINTGNQTATQVPYSNITSGLAATNVQAAIDEIDTTLDTLSSSSHGHTNKPVLDGITNAGSGAIITVAERSKLAGVEVGATADQNASEVPYSNVGSGLVAVDVQAAIDEVEGRVDALESSSHDHSNKVILDGITSVGSGAIITVAERNQLSSAEQTTNKGVVGGYASLDGSGTVPLSQLPDAVKNGDYKGAWNASTNTPILADGIGSNGDNYKVSVGGTQDFGSGPITFAAGQSVVYNGTSSSWEKIGTDDAVNSVNGQIGAVVLDSDDIDDSASTTNKWMTPTEKTKLAGIEDGAEVNPTASEIKTLYESNANTNEFTDSEKTKLAGIEVGATADQNASEVPYSNTTSGLTATQVQAAIDEVDGRVDALETSSHTHSNKAILDGITSVGSGAIITAAERSKLAGIESGATADQNASEVPYDNVGSGLVATQVQAAIDEVDGRVDALEASSHTHSNKAILDGITSVGSGQIITATERSNLHTHSNKAILDGITSVGSGAIITAAERSGLHTHSNKAVLDGITSVGSGAIITVAERSGLHTHGNKPVLDLITDAGSGVIMSSTERTKLGGISAGATVGATWDVNISGQPSIISQAEAEGGAATTQRIWTALRIAQAIAALTRIRSHVSRATGSIPITTTTVISYTGVEIPDTSIITVSGSNEFTCVKSGRYELHAVSNGQMDYAIFSLEGSLETYIERSDGGAYSRINRSTGTGSANRGQSASGGRNIGMHSYVIETDCVAATTKFRVVCDRPSGNNGTLFGAQCSFTIKYLGPS